MGRADELGVLDRVLAGLDEGRPAAVEIRGEPGIGKTRLLLEFGARADRRGWLVLRGSASELERDLPFSVFVDALDEYLSGLDPGVFGRLSKEVRTELARVFPSLSGLASAFPPAIQHERYRAHRAVRAVLEHLAESQPLVLVLDDLQWADAASVELLGALLRRPPAMPVLLLMAVRPRQVHERLVAALEWAHRASESIRLDLGPLSLRESRELLGDGFDDADAAELYAESGGNPFYLEQLARSVDRTSAATVPETWMSAIGVPPAVATSIGEELGRLSDDARRLLEGAAVTGDPFVPELAAAAAGTSEAAAMDAIDEFLRIDLIRTTDVPRRFRFRHPLVRRAVYEATAAGWRLGAHERCAAELAARGAPVAARAHHVERSAREGDVEAAAVLRAAGEEALPLAPASAARWFAAALRLLPKSSARERVELLHARATALTAVGRLGDAHSILLEATDDVPDDAHALRARLVRACAGVESALGLHDQAHSRLTDALDGLPDSASPEGVALMIELAMNGFWRAKYDVMQESAVRAARNARSLGDAPLTAAALAVLALANSMSGAADMAEADRSEAAALVESLSDPELARRPDAAVWLAGAELYLDRYADADAHANRALALGRATGQGELFLVLVQILGRVWYVRGKLDDAAELLDGGIEAARLSGNGQALAWNLFNRSVVALAVGDLELAYSTAEESVDLSRALGVGFHSAWAAVRLAGAHLEAGRPARAIEVLLDGAGGEEQAFIPGSWRAYSLELLTRCWLELDRHDEAEWAAVRAETWASVVQLPLAAAWAARAAAAVDLHGGNHRRAAEQALVSAREADDAGAPIEAALARILAGRAFAEAGQGDRAIQELERAAAALDACGALRYRDRAEYELRRLGRRIHRRTRPGNTDVHGIESLTERELQVSRLVRDRKTNGEIAVELFLSKKTVETHLRNIFHKVNVSSRVELARVIERAERVDGGNPGSVAPTRSSSPG